MDQTKLIKAVLSSWGAQDVAWIFDAVTDDVVYQLNGSRDGLFASRSVQGKDAFRNSFVETSAHFDYLRFDPTVLGIFNDVARVQVKYVLHHWASGHSLTGTKRLVFEIAGNRIARINVFYDGALVQAFLQLTAANAGMGSILAMSTAETSAALHAHRPQTLLLAAGLGWANRTMYRAGSHLPF